MFSRYLVLDYVIKSGEKYHYVCPARAGDEPGSLVDWGWTFRDSPCIFLQDNCCAIETVKPRGGRAFSCHVMAGNKLNLAKFGKKEGARAWRNSLQLEELLVLARSKSSGHVVPQ